MNGNNNIIQSLYKRYRKKPNSLDGRNLYLLADYMVDEQGLELDEDCVIFTGMDKASPFREILLNNIHGVEDLGALLAIVMHSSIIFFNKTTHEATVHIKPASLRDKIVHAFSIRWFPHIFCGT